MVYVCCPSFFMINPISKPYKTKLLGIMSGEQSCQFLIQGKFVSCCRQADGVLHLAERKLFVTICLDFPEALQQRTLITF